LVYCILRLNWGNVGVFGVYTPSKHLAAFSTVCTDVLEPEIIREVFPVILQKLFTELGIRQVNIFVHRKTR
jgi:hypothetical protein